MAFAKGTSVFNSCNKAGAVVHFTSHLASNPNDWNALMWRAKAYSILGQNQNAINDLDRAIEVGRGVQWKLAMAVKRTVIGSDMSECLGFLKRITDEHPDCWEAHYRFGSFQRAAGNKVAAIKSLRTAKDIAVEKGEFYNPLFCWISLALGELWFDEGLIGVAINYFMDSVRSSPTHTISYINLCHMHILKGEFVKARENFETATGLNPTLVKEIFKFDSLYDYLKDLNEKLQADELQRQQSSSTGNLGYQPVSSVPVPAAPQVQQYNHYTSVGQLKAQSLRNQTYQEASNVPSVLQGHLSKASSVYERGLVSQRQPRSLSARSEGAKDSSNIYYASAGKTKTGYGESELQKDFSYKLTLSSQASNSKRTPKAVPTGSKGERNHSPGATGGQRGNGSGRGGDGGGSGSDDDDDNPYSGMNVSEIWKKLQKESSNIKLYGRHKYVQSKCGTYWYSKDTAGHADAAFKRYLNTKSYLIFIDSLDAKMRPMRDKHESREGTSIKKSDMVGVGGK